ncbi:MAG: aminoacyl-tRNA hydrolase [Candidatus Levybacteria bacterium RIFCSPHIGHO2_02_FULL_37_13]|nr:MAG: aminoacyl-tRNA hydrolase [Candidatus Levybacteria bacterium RIFCSPHIGHO2_02_FULL_37_13]OGH39381.1 MAG: aminoacyl-tRNA hydrolase [Candidatus Levybacteria bacterium RIFCSPLOWO2_01_FULL_37_26]
MKLIVGLGNPGTKYEKTRHNVGFMVVEQFLKDFEPVKDTLWIDNKKFKSDIAEINWKPFHGKEEKAILAKPKTYMNNSGLAVQLLTSFYKVPTSDVWIVHDDIDLPIGSMKIRFGGGTAGHHGAESIMEQLGTDKFWRFRLGIGVKSQRPEAKGQMIKNVEDFVLGNFTGAERGKVKDMVKKGSKAIQTGLEVGLESAMNRFNTK